MESALKKLLAEGMSADEVFKKRKYSNMSTTKQKKPPFYWRFLYIWPSTVNLIFLYSATLLLNHFEPEEKICKESTVGVILMGSQFCEHVLQVVINSELLALAVSTRLYMMVLDSVPRMESTLIRFLRPTVKGQMARSVWIFLPMRNKRQLSGRVPADDSLSGFYPQIYRITAGLSFWGKMVVVFPIDDG